MCPAKTVSNAKPLLSKALPGTTASLQCDTGYVTGSGNPSQTAHCQSDGRWFNKDCHGITIHFMYI